MGSNALTTIEHGTLPTARDWETMLSMSEVLVKSGMLPAHIKSAAAAVAIIQKGRELGIQPMYALSNIVNIQGKPTANAELMLALIYRDHGDRAVVFMETDADVCRIGYMRRGWAKPEAYTFTMDDAKRAGLLTNATWQKYPAAMLRARCISAVARMAFPDTIGGLYTAEELGAEVDEEGTPIMVIEEPRPIRAAATPVDRPERLAPLSAPRVKGTVDHETQAATVVERAAARAVGATSDRPLLNRKLWARASAFYGKDKAEGALREWAKVSFPDAVDADGQPSIAALTDEQVAEMIAELDKAEADEPKQDSRDDE